ncbi:hypothetical protein FQ154_01655 [Paeniglutamicibacter gangotriensis]|uniref:Uncharacterized protein n=1 Tax=Paeniglutamicibacter gangotriensis TaxID=254787 RepID=A0A5B0EPW8_9MICC|nr:hypothetical protein [Paeniglutamicibacter gangotriensis]KAA0979891.1 hypothetical protein FQ154_01655 [Paeniglutamicibacter gangotriensis]
MATDNEICDRYPDDFSREIGRLALAFADAEGRAAELILVCNRHQPLTDGGWSRSGQQLGQVLRQCFDDSRFQRVCDELQDLTVHRNFYIHGEWTFRADGTAAIMKRQHLKEHQAASYDINPVVTVGHVREIADRVIAVDKELVNYIVLRMAQIHEPG